MDSVTNLLLGLPASGKTTFLAAMWHVVHSNEVSGALSLKSLEGDREHLNHICEQWRRFQQMERTHPSSEKSIRMRLVEEQGSEGVELVVPDMSGESFETFLDQRQWPAEFDEFLQAVDGLLLFVHPNRVGEPVTINQTEPLIAELGEEQVTPRLDAEAVKHYGPRLNPTHVKLVDALQLIAGRRLTRRHYRVAVIISAWDVAADERQTPKTWLEARLPLLHQYLWANAESIELRIYGVSAQGGDLKGDRQTLEKIMVQSERIQVVEGEASSHDITAPLRWLMTGHP